MNANLVVFICSSQNFCLYLYIKNTVIAFFSQEVCFCQVFQPDFFSNLLMLTTCHAYLIHFDSLILIMFGEAFHYAAFFNLLFLYFSQTEIFSSAMYSQFPLYLFSSLTLLIGLNIFMGTKVHVLYLVQYFLQAYTFWRITGITAMKQLLSVWCQKHCATSCPCYVICIIYCYATQFIMYHLLFLVKVGWETPF
jgi:hypothetical protein